MRPAWSGSPPRSCGPRSAGVFSRVLGPLGKCGLGFGSERHAAWSLPGLKGGVLAQSVLSSEAQKIFWLFDRAWRGQTDTRFRDSLPDAGYHHSAWRTLLPTAAEREVW